MERLGWYYAYDAAGNMIYEGDDPYEPQYDSVEYDDAGRVISYRLPGTQQFTALEYDHLNRVTKRSESNSAVNRYTKYVYNSRSWVTSQIDSDPTASPLEDGPTTSLTYDASGHLLSLTDPVGNTTSWTFDDVGRVIEEENELEDSRTWDYDNAGRLIEKVDRLGRSTQYVYDARNWLTDEKWYDGENLVRTLSFDYDLTGRLTDASDPTATYAFVLDDAGRVLSETQTLAALSFDIEYESLYNDNGMRTQLQAVLDGTDDFKNTFAYDDMSRVTRVEQQDVTGGNTVADKRLDLSYNDRGLVSRIARYADLSATEYVASSFMTYDEFGRVTKIIHTTDTAMPETGWGDGVLAGYALTWDVASRITSIDSYIDGLSEFAYDNSDQLLDADHASQADEDYSFDDNGNRTMTGYTTGDNNQLTSDGIYNYTYDAEGNRLTRTKISNSYVTEYGWDHRNRLISITEKNNSNVVLSTVAYAYDVFDQRISNSVDPDGPGGSSAVLTVFSWESNQVNLQFDGANASDLTHRYLWNPDAVDQVFADEAVSSLSAAGSILWPFADHQGTLRDLAEYDSGTDETTIANHRIFSTFGQLLSETDSNINHLYAWTGRELDEESGMQFHRGRYYDSTTGRWISEDPIGFAAGDTNLARVVSNLPTSLRDPSGLNSVNSPGSRPWWHAGVAGFMIPGRELTRPLRVIPSFRRLHDRNSGWMSDVFRDTLNTNEHDTTVATADFFGTGAAWAISRGLSASDAELNQHILACFVAGTPVLMANSSPSEEFLETQQASIHPAYWTLTLGGIGLLISERFSRRRCRPSQRQSGPRAQVNKERRAFSQSEPEVYAPAPEVFDDIGWLSHVSTVTHSSRECVIGATVSDPHCIAQITPSQSPSRCRLAIGLLSAALIAAGLILGVSSALNIALPAGSVAQAPGEGDTPVEGTSSFQPIETIRVGQRVITGTSDSTTVVESSTWRRVTLRGELAWEDGTIDVINVESLQPIERLIANGVTVGAVMPIPLDLVEMGLPADLKATVLSIDPCPSIAPGPGRVVLNTVNHLNPSVVELTVRDSSGRVERVRPTSNHRFYSLDRNEWTCAGYLRPDERLKGLREGLRVVSVAPLPGVHTVYNLTVEGDHTYLVSSLAVHNANDCPPPGPPPGPPVAGPEPYVIPDQLRALYSVEREILNELRDPNSPNHTLLLRILEQIREEIANFPR